MFNFIKLKKNYLLCVLLIVVLGLVDLPYPFHGDQALFTVGAREMSQGEVLYRDFWDLKQPGIYYFYFAAGLLFGFSEVGIHLFELLYMVAFTVTLLLSLKGYFKNLAILYLVPLLTIGFYYAAASQWHLTQLEALVGFPIFLSLYFSHQAIECDRKRTIFFFLSGLMGGVVLLFKLMFLPILTPFWLSAILLLVFKKREHSWTGILKCIGSVVLGVFVPLLIPTIYFASQNTLPILYETFFVYPPQIASGLPHSSPSQLLGGLRWFLVEFALVVTLAIPGIYFSISSRRDFISANLIGWGVSGLCIILVQRGWAYHYLLLLTPMGVLAAKGIDAFWDAFKKKRLIFSLAATRVITLLVIVLLSLPTLKVFAQKIVFLASNRFAITSEQRSHFQNQVNPDYPRILGETSFLSKPDTLSGDIFVIGDPLFYLLSGRKQAITLNGWSPELLLPKQWEQLVDELKVAKPSYVFVDQSSLQLIQDRSINTDKFIEHSYDLFHKDDLGNWYVLHTQAHS